MDGIFLDDSVVANPGSTTDVLTSLGIGDTNYSIAGTDTELEAQVEQNTEAIATKSSVSLSGSTLTIDGTEHTLADPAQVSSNTTNIGNKSSVSVDPVGTVTKIDALEVDGSRYTIQPQDYVYNGSFEQSNITSFDVDERGPSYSYGTNVWYNGSTLDVSGTFTSSVNIILSREDNYVHWNSSKLNVHRSAINQSSFTGNIRDVDMDVYGDRVIYLDGNTLYGVYRGSAEFNLLTTTGSENALKCALRTDGGVFAVLFASSVDVYNTNAGYPFLVGTISIQQGTTGYNVDLEGNPLIIAVETNSSYDIYHNANGTLTQNGGSFSLNQSIIKEVGADKPRFGKEAYFLHANNALYYKPDFSFITHYGKLIDNVSLISKHGNDYVLKNGDVLKHYKLREGSFHDWHIVIRPIITNISKMMGRPEDSTDMGVFSGNVLTDFETAKQNLQELADEIETKSTVATVLTATDSGVTIDNNTTTLVQANTGTTTDTLTSLKVGTVNYDVSTIVANPNATATADLTKLTVGSTTYNVPTSNYEYKLQTSHLSTVFGGGNFVDVTGFKSSDALQITLLNNDPKIRLHFNFLERHFLYMNKILYFESKELLQIAMMSSLAQHHLVIDQAH